MLGTELDKTLAFDLRGSWQVRALVEAKGQTCMVLMSVLAHTYDAAVATMMMAAFPWYEGPQTPMPLPILLSAGKVAKSGAIVADVQTSTGKKTDAVVYRSGIEMRDDFRRLADRMKLSDAERVEMFKCAQRWVVADRRLDPTFDPKDPDAKRLH